MQFGPDRFDEPSVGLGAADIAFLELLTGSRRPGQRQRYPSEVFICYTSTMPRISEFYGIAVYIYYRDHNPPHFHAIYGDSEAIIEIRTGAILEGRLPRRATKLVAE